MQTFFTLKDFDVSGKTVLVRTDFNVPLDKNGRITDDSKIKASLPTIQYLLKNKAKVIIMSHLGRPDGKFVKEFKMDNVAKKLSSSLKKKVKKLDDCINLGDETQDYDLILLENLRFYKEEEENDKNFASSLASLADLYVNDAFGVSHRAHASVEAITHLMPSAAGFLMEKEITELSKALDPKHPFIAIIGGSKLSTKIPVIKRLLKKADKVLLGGAMVFTFYKAKGYDIGKSMVEPDQIKTAKSMLNSKKLVLPEDIVCAKALKPKQKTITVAADSIPKGMIGLDLGKETIKNYTSIIRKAKTILWNGPLGAFEVKPFDNSTNAIAKAVSNSNAISIVGGGDTASAVRRFKFTHISTGGGASLEFFEKELPGIAALKLNYKCFKPIF